MAGNEIMATKSGILNSIKYGLQFGYLDNVSLVRQIPGKINMVMKYLESISFIVFWLIDASVNLIEVQIYIL